MAETVFEGSTKFLKPQEGSEGGQAYKRHVYTVTTADFTAAATTEAIDVGTDDDGVDFPANAYVLSGHIELDEVCAGGSASAVTAELGDTVDPNELMVSSDVFTGATLGRTWDPGVYTPLTLEATAYAPELLITVTGDNVDQLTTGRMRVVIDYWLPDAL